MKTQYLIFLIITFIVVIQVATKNPYRVLNVPAYATFKEIKSSYRKLSLMYHPDKHRNFKNSDEVKRKMIEINEAYEAVKEKRSVDDTDEDDNHLQSLIMESIAIIIVIIVFYKVQLLFFKFLIWILEVCSYFVIWTFTIFHVIDRFFSHHFEEENNQYAVCLVTSIFITMLFSWMFPKKKIVAKKE